MEDILASIRRILNEDEVAPASPAPEHPPAVMAPVVVEQPNAGGSGGGEDDGVLVLDEAMLVVPPPAPAPVPAPSPEPPPAAFPVREVEAVVPPALNTPPVLTPTAWESPGSPTLDGSPEGAGGLLAPENAAAAASSVGALLRTISAERSSQVHRGGPTIEDLVREELRPLLKVWLDQHLPPMVERLVRQEIERVTGGAG